jgi:hypothetical protein
LRRLCIALCSALLSLFPLTLACQSVPTTPDNSIPCEQSIDAFCSSAPDGCPRSLDDFCSWLARRGTPDIWYGGPLDCQAARLTGWELDTDAGTRFYLFDQHGIIAAVLEFGGDPPAQCLGGPPFLHGSQCVNAIVAYRCALDTGRD